MATDDLSIRIRALDAAQARAELEKVSKELSRVGGSAQKTGKQTKEAAGHFKLLGGAMSGIKYAAGIAGFAGLAYGIKDVVTAGVSMQEQQSQLRQALTVSGIAGKNAYNQILAAADKLATRGGFATPQELQGISQYVRLTGSATKAIQLNAAATNLARGAHLGFTTAQRMLAQVLTGNVGRLQKYIGIIQPVKTAVDALTASHKLNIYQLDLQAKAMGKAGPMWLKQQELYAGINPQALLHAQLLDKQATAQEALTKIQAKFGGSTAAFSRTAAGSLSNLRNTLEQLAARIGVVLLPIITKIAKAFADVARTIADHWPQISAAIMSVVKPVWDFAKAIFTALARTHLLIPILAGVVAGFVAFKVILLATAAFEKVQAAIEGVRAGLVALGIIEAATGVETEALSATMKSALIASGIGLVVLALVLLVTHFKIVKQVAGEVIAWLGGAVRAVGQVISSVFQGAATFVSGAFNEMKNIARIVVTTIGNIFKTLFGIITWPFREAWKIIQKIANWIVGAFNWVVNKVKSVFNFIVGIPGKIANAAGSLLSDATFGLLHQGGIVKPRYFSSGGPVGQDTIPGWLQQGEFVLNRQTTAAIGEQNLNAMNAGQLGAGGAGNWTIQPGTVVIQLDRRTIATAVVRYTRERAARGSTSLVGGAMTTGSTTSG